MINQETITLIANAAREIEEQAESITYLCDNEECPNANETQEDVDKEVKESIKTALDKIKSELDKAYDNLPTL